MEWQYNRINRYYLMRICNIERQYSAAQTDDDVTNEKRAIFDNGTVFARNTESEHTYRNNPFHSIYCALKLITNDFSKVIDNYFELFFI